MIEQFVFQGKVLNPWSAGREAAAQALGIALFRGSAPDLFSAHIVLFLCTCTDRECMMASYAPDTLRDKAWVWIDANFTGKPEALTEEAEVIQKMFTKIAETRAVPRVDSDDLINPNDLDPNS